MLASPQYLNARCTIFLHYFDVHFLELKRA